MREAATAVVDLPAARRAGLRRATLLLTQTTGDRTRPAVDRPPQPLLVMPHCLPSSAQVFGTHGTHTFAVPVVSQRSFGWQVPQSSVPPQPSSDSAAGGAGRRAVERRAALAVSCKPDWSRRCRTRACRRSGCCARRTPRRIGCRSSACTASRRWRCRRRRRARRSDNRRSRSRGRNRRRPSAVLAERRQRPGRAALPLVADAVDRAHAAGQRAAAAVARRCRIRRRARCTTSGCRLHSVVPADLAGQTVAALQHAAGAGIGHLPAVQALDLARRRRGRRQAQRR